MKLKFCILALKIKPYYVQEFEITVEWDKCQIQIRAKLGTLDVGNSNSSLHFLSLSLSIRTSFRRRQEIGVGKKPGSATTTFRQLRNVKLNFQQRGQLQLDHGAL